MAVAGPATTHPAADNDDNGREMDFDDMRDFADQDLLSHNLTLAILFGWSENFRTQGPEHYHMYFVKKFAHHTNNKEVFLKIFRHHHDLLKDHLQ